jgi:enterobacterial common antigen flippase
MGGAAVINILANIIRMKFVAVFIGTVGVGLMSSFTSIHNILCVLTGFGIHSSSVREIAASHALKDEKKIGTTIIVLRRISIFAGFCGMVLTTSFASLISQIVLDEPKYTFEILLLGLAVMLTIITNGQLALLQGMRLISLLAKAQIIGNVIGVSIAIITLLSYGIKGIVPSIIVVAVVRLCISWYCTRKIDVMDINIGLYHTFKEASSMVKLGFIFMWNSLLVSGVNIFTISLINNKLNAESVGIYSAAFTLSSVAVGFILQAMGADYYPKLTSVKDDKVELNKIVNQQTEIAMLLSLSPLLTLFLFAPVFITFCYNESFLPAVDLLRWFVLASMLKMICWPLGFVLIALGKDLIFYLTETFGNLLNILFIYLFYLKFGLSGIAMASLFVCLLYAVVVYFICKRFTNYKYFNNTKIIFLFTLIIFTLSLLLLIFTQSYYFYISSSILTFFSVYICAALILINVRLSEKVKYFLSFIPYLNCFIMKYKRV